jgi:LmbE family N-acetylglucosaminyl deacetylase
MILHSCVLQTTLFRINSNSILVIAPHPDDESFGCSGLIAQKTRNGAEVYILFLTNGEKSLSTISKSELKQVRQANAIAAAQILGINESHLLWLNLPDGAIPRKKCDDFEPTAQAIANLIHTYHIDEVFTTHYLDGWSDHIAAYELSLAALSYSQRPITLYLYWVWAWYYVGFTQIFTLSWNQMRLLPLGSSMTTKQQALKCYYDSITPDGDPYMGNLPKMFLKAFDWPYEVFEKVEYK